MGATGSYTAKATIDPLLYPFTKWATKDVTLFIQRGQYDLPETFALRKHEFDYLIGVENLSFTALRDLFKEIFDTDNNGLVDKFEVMCIILMTSKVSSLEKVNFFFQMFNFNDKGYLNESELTLLLMAVTRGAYKIDQKFIPPSAKSIKSLVSEAFTFCHRERDQLRKPELVEFVQHNVDVAAFLECWRGHASQVLLPSGLKWRDLSFPAHHISIAPSKEWLCLGLPPEEFVHWRRRDKVGTEIDALAYLFVHTESFLKTIDRRPVYKGDGVIGTGFIKQGYLADRWVLNALAALTARPFTIFYLFATTGQEDDGRYCCKFYECGSWRSVYVDDRIPCGPNRYPLFATSSSPLEAWPTILEKALAKYLGSYGHVGAASLRSDCVLTALRFFTGGHVYRHSTRDYVWSANGQDFNVSPERQGATKILQYIAQGAIIAFGRSVALGMMSTPSTSTSSGGGAAKPVNRQMLPPLGHLFPVLGSTKVKGVLHFILRDPYGLLQDANPEVDPTTGICNTFTIKVDDVPLFYDSIFFVRFPDSLRERALVHQLQTWSTEILSQVSKNRYSPACFQMVVESKVNGKKGQTMVERKLRRRSTAAEIDAMLHNADGDIANPLLDDGAGGGVRKLTMKELAPYLRLKDRTDFTRINDKKSAFLNSHSTGTDKDGSSGKKTASSNDDDAVEDDRVEVCLTLSSNCEWSIAGAEYIGAELRAKLVPSTATLKRLRNHFLKVLYQRKALEIQLHNLRVEEAKLLAAQNEMTTEDSQNNAGSRFGSKRNSRLSLRTPSGDDNSRRGSVNFGVRSNRSSFLAVTNPGAPIAGGAAALPGATPSSDLAATGTEAPPLIENPMANDDSTRDQEDATEDGESGIEEMKGPNPQQGGPASRGMGNPATSSAPGAATTLKKLSDISWEEIERESIVLLKQQLNTQFVFSSRRCWESKPMLLVPGVYRLFADISFTGSATMRAHQERQQDHDVHAHDEMKRDSIATAATADTEAESAYLSRCIPYEHVKMMCVPRDLYEAPWLDEAVVRKYRNRRHVFHGLAGDGWTTTGRRLSISAGADKGASSNNISSKSAAVTAVSGSRKSLMRRGSSNHGSEGNKSQQDLDGQTVASQGSLTSLQYLEHKIFPRQQAMQDVADDATTLPPLEHMIWLEVSSFDKVMLTPGMGAGGGVVGESAMDDDEYVTRLYEEEDEERVYRAARGQSAQDAPTRPAAPIPLAAPSGSLEQISEAASSAVSASVSASATATGTSTTTGTGTATQPAPTMIASTAVASILEGDEGSVQSASIAEDSAATMPKPIIELTHRLDMDVLDSTWPFMSESQTEAASSYLVDQLTAQREAAEDLATQFVDLASRVNSLKKAVIVRQRQSTLRPNL